MKVILTSSLGGAFKVNGKRIPSVLLGKNGLLDRLRSIWVKDAKVLLICASPDDYEKNDSICGCLKESFPMSGLSISCLEKCDGRSLEMIDRSAEMDVILLGGGHVPTQNRFMKQLCLKEKLDGYQGIVIAWSAGSMNCAETVYAAPELEGEATDPHYERWISGIGITQTNILPHFQSLKDECLDGLRVVEDIAYADSMGHELLALNDGSYIIIEDGHETLYGEAYLIKDGQCEQICKDEETLAGENIFAISLMKEQHVTEAGWNI